MTNLLINLFIKDNNNIDDQKVRENYGVLACVVGILCNMILFFAKLLIGFFLNSVAVMADSINNLSDCGSSIFTIIGFKMANKPADNEHPFGHGRMEYLGALGVSIVILFMGLEFLKSSIFKIFNKDPIFFTIASIIVLFLTVLVKLWLHFFNKKMGNKINSDALKILSVDARNDALITLFTIVTLITYQRAGINLDAYVGVFIAILLIKNGFGIAKNTFSPLLGESTDPKFARELKQKIESYDGVIGTHDLIVHNYGHGRSMATIHVEVDHNIDIDTSHNLIDRVECDIKGELGLFLLIHMDPIDLSDSRIMLLSKIVIDRLETYENVSAHDFRIVNAHGQTNFIFDLEVPHGFGKEKEKRIVRYVKEAINKEEHNINCIINIETGYVFKDE